MEPLILKIDGWELEVKISDLGTEVRMHTDSQPRTTHFMRLDRAQSALLHGYLDRNLP